ncbi:MAG TPA: DnaJ domain-containing protein [Polyangiaceae bacterium]|nr:DnaJ domain-containing protein [Polyangiaceae bacterium]
MSQASVAGWLAVLDDLTYYELFGLTVDASADDVRSAFHAFCEIFHPDRYFGSPEADRIGVSTIFKRATEAYLVLSDAGLREHYDAQLRGAQGTRPQRISFSSRSRPPASRSPGPAKLEDSVRTPTARPFARRAEELIGAGDLRQAKLQLVMANHMDPQNEALETALKDLETRLAERR